MAVSISEPQAPQNYMVPNAGGGTTALNAVGTAGAQVIAADPTRKSITFINPNLTSQNNLIVFQMADVNGNSLAGTTFAAPGGGLPIIAAGLVIVTGDAAQSAWGAVASANGSGLTIMTSRT